MARRMIDDSMWANEQFAEMPMGARLLQIGIINHADDQGRVKANPAYLRAQIFPYDDVATGEIQKWLELMARNGTIILYEVDSRQYAQLCNWWKYQTLQYAQPSQWPRPAGWHDRIRRTLTKGVIVTCNWLKVNNEPIVDTCDEDGNPLPAKRQTATADNGPDSPEQTEETASYLGDDSPESSPEDTRSIEDQYNLTKGEDHARESEPSSTTQAPPSKTGDPYMDVAWAKHNGGKRFLSRRQTALMAIQSELPDLKLTPEQFTALVDCHLTEKGTKVLADSEGELADRELGGAQTFVIALCKIGRRFREVGGPRLVWESWRKHDKRKNPSDHQLLQHAAQMIAGQFEDKPAEKQTLSYKEWKIRTYACDNPLVIGIPEAQLRAAYEQAIRMH